MTTIRSTPRRAHLRALLTAAAGLAAAWAAAGAPYPRGW
jgi:hypothetical protein